MQSWLNQFCFMLWLQQWREFSDNGFGCGFTVRLKVLQSKTNMFDRYHRMLLWSETQANVVNQHFLINWCCSYNNYNWVWLTYSICLTNSTWTHIQWQWKVSNVEQNQVPILIWNSLTQHVTQGAILVIIVETICISKLGSSKCFKKYQNLHIYMGISSEYSPNSDVYITF